MIQSCSNGNGFRVPPGRTDTASRPKKVLFVTPPYRCGIAEIAGRWVPLNLVYLAGAARQAGLAAEIYDAMTKNHGYPQIEERLRASAPDYVAVTAITSTIDDAIKTLELAKRTRPETVTILGGIHPTFMYEEVLRSSDAIDYIVCGEGETTVAELLQVLEEGGDPAAVPGLAFRQGARVLKTLQRPLLERIDDLPAAWDLLDWNDYTYLFIPDSRLGTISTSRGCSLDCTFCSQQKFWQRSWRARNPQKVADELEYLHRSFGVNVFLLADEHPTRDRGRWEALLDAVTAKGLPIYLLMETKAADIIRDRDILGKYRQAGIIWISLGIEANRPAADEAKQALDLIREQQIVSEASFMLGLPEETSASVKETLHLAQYCNPDFANFLAVAPWPYSDMYAGVRQYIRETDYSRFNMVDPVIEPKQMTTFQVEVALADCYRKFYMGKMAEVMTMKNDFKRAFILRATKLFMGSSFIMKKLCVGMFGKIKRG
ncbi:MAG TPA: cobalamin-dependent protein [Geobacteraceae bacterium]